MDAVSFDRAADYYDETRALPDDAGDELAGILAGELAGRQPCFEIGVGTGRIALPLRARGITLAGADIAEAMLRRLIVNAGNGPGPAHRPPVPVLLADATRLPLAPSSFGSVLASHVLHLIPHWRVAVDEAVRVLRPGGTLLVDYVGLEGRDAPPPGRSAARAPWREAVRESLRRHGIVRRRPGVTSVDAVTGYLGGGVTARPLPPVTLTVRRTLGRAIEDMERQIYSWTWPYAAEQMRGACADIRSWAAAENVSLDAEIETERAVQWWAFDLPG